MLVVVVEELVESGFCVGFAGEDAVVQLVDRVFEIVFGVVEVIIDSLAGSVGQGRGVNDEAPKFVVVDRMLEGLKLVFCGIIVVGERAEVSPVIVLARAVDEE